MAVNLLEGSWRSRRWQGPFSETTWGPTEKKKTGYKAAARYDTTGGKRGKKKKKDS
jgi:hypothetical protein